MFLLFLVSPKNVNSTATPGSEPNTPTYKNVRSVVCAATAQDAHRSRHNMRSRSPVPTMPDNRRDDDEPNKKSCTRLSNIV